MRSWYEFGYNGFPSGEQRRRFYRQRDDPCDSEEERDYDDETNDRPIFYYPLRPSEEGSRSSYSGSESPASSESDTHSEFANLKGEYQPLHARSYRPRGARRPRTSRRGPHEEPLLRCLLHSTLYEDMPSWYGSSSVVLAPLSPAAGEVFTLQHGGAACATPFGVSGQFSVWRWRTASVPTSAAARGTHVACIRVAEDLSLPSLLCWDALHPTLRLSSSPAVRARPRIGHCAVALAPLDAPLLQYFLTDHRQGHAPRVPGRPGAGAGRGDDPGRDGTAGLLAGDVPVQLHVSLVVGGASRLIDMSSAQSSGYVGHGVWSENDATALRGPNLDRVAIGAAHILSHPVLCLTLIADAASQPRQHTLYFPLDTPAMSALAPRAFATLTAWPDAATDASAVCSFAYLGGTDNARDPLAFFEVEVFRLRLDTWTWSSNPVTTYGAKPAPRFGHSASLASEDACLLLFGGVAAGHVYLNDLHVLDLRTRVWREVFIPFGTDVPRRAFFTASVMTLAEVAGCELGRGSSGGGEFAERVAAMMARNADHLDTAAPWCSSSAAEAGAETARAALAAPVAEGDDGEVWSASITSAKSCGALVLVGGECEGRPVASAWSCALRNGSWRCLSFPLRGAADFVHVARASAPSPAAGAPLPQHVGRLPSRTDFQTALRAMEERARACDSGGGSSARHSATRTTATSTSVTEPYIAACHGSLPHALLLPRAATSQAERLVLVGGSRGPPVSVATEVSLMGTSLQETAALWLLASHQQQSLTATKPLSQIPHLHTFFFRGSAALAHAAQSALWPSSGKVDSPATATAEEARASRAVCESVLDGQLTEWTRLARKRLREGES